MAVSLVFLKICLYFYKEERDKTTRLSGARKPSCHTNRDSFEYLFTGSPPTPPFYLSNVGSGRYRCRKRRDDVKDSARTLTGRQSTLVLWNSCARHALGLQDPGIQASRKDAYSKYSNTG